MKKFILFPLFCLIFAACNDDTESTPVSSNNSNSNATITNAGNVRHVSESSINLAKVASRLEIPRLIGGNSNLFVVHTASGYGVNYAMEYDITKKASRWTAYQWYNGFSHNITSAEEGWNRNYWFSGQTFNGYGGGGDPFQPDPLIPAAYQTTLYDHRGNGYDRGHMLASADRLNNKTTNGQTFYLSNMHPQLNGFNSNGIWLTLEGYIRSQYDTNKFRDTLYVVKGGTIDTEYTTVRGNGDPLVCPNYFYMALLCKVSNSTKQGGYKAIAFWMEHKANSDTKVANYAISIDELEKKTGIDFFCNLPDDIEKTVESNMVLSAWGL